MPYTLVQSNHKIQASPGAATCALAFSSNVTAGNLLICGLSYDSTGATSVTMAGGGTWAKIGSQTDATNSQIADFWYCANATGGATTPTATAVGGTGVVSSAPIVIAEFSGVRVTSPLDVSDTTKAFATSSATANANTSNSITPVAGDLIVALYQGDNGVQPSITAGTGFTIGPNEPGQSAAPAVSTCVMEFRAAPAGSQNATFSSNLATDRYTAQIAAFFAAPGGNVMFNPIPFVAPGRI